jgi:hypothetical protein
MPETSLGMGPLTTALNVVGTALTGSHANNLVTFDTHGSESVTFYVNYVKGGETGAEVRVEVWDSETGWKLVPYSHASSGSVLTLTSTSSVRKRWNVRRLGRFEKQMRVSTATTAGSSNGTTLVVVQVQLMSSGFPIAGNVT